MIEVYELTRRFAEIIAVDHLSFNVARGEIFGLVGPDGAGKTTTIRMLSSLIEPTSGWAHMAGHDTSNDPQAVRDSIGYMAQRFGLYADLTVNENLAFYADLYGVPELERNQLLDPLLRMTGMEPFRQRQAGKLSGGMKQKLALMCTLIHRPEILLLDEPTTGLDPASRIHFWDILLRLVSDGMTVVVTTAYFDEAERCDRVAFIDRGKLIRCDSPQKLKAGLENLSYEVTAPNVRAVRRWLEKQPKQTCGFNVEPAGNVLHLFTSDDPSVIAKQLETQGLGPIVIREIAPSLEDIFVMLVRNRTKPS
jgi:ABC-2 type transport system ATP-binding protein